MAPLTTQFSSNLFSDGVNLPGPKDTLAMGQRLVLSEILADYFQDREQSWLISSDKHTLR